MNENMPRSGDVSGGTSNVRDTVREKAAGLANDAKQQARAQYDEKKEVARGELDTLASALRRAGSEVGESGGMSGRLISTAADRIESFSRSIEGKDLDEVIYSVERFARSNPAAFLGGAVAIGFLASRFLKSSNRPVASRDFYSSEAYGGYARDRVDSAIGSTGYGAGMTYGSELDTGSSSFGTQSGSEFTSGLGSTTPGTRTGSTDTAGDFGIGRSGGESSGGTGRR